MIWELNMEGWVGIHQARLRSEDIQKEKTSWLKCKVKTQPHVSAIHAAGEKKFEAESGNRQCWKDKWEPEASRGFVPTRWWFIKICHLRVKRKQSQSFCNGSCQPSLIVFYPAVENYSRDMSKSIYSIPSCLPNITTNTNKFIVHWIPLCNWIELWIFFI